MNSPNVKQLGPLSIVSYAGHTYKVEALVGTGVTLRRVDAALSPPVYIELITLVTDQDYRLHGADTPAKGLEPYEAYFDALPKKVQEEARTLQGHMREMVTGYWSGQSSDVRRNEPKHKFDPERTTLSARVQTKAEELGLKERRMWALYTAYRNQGVYGLVNKKTIPYAAPLANVHPDLLQGIRDVARNNAGKSTASLTKLRRDVTKHLQKQIAAGTLHIPSPNTFNTIARTVLKGTGYLRSTRESRSVAVRPKRVYRPVVATRAGEFVQLDASRWEVLAYDSVTRKLVRYRLLLAIDLRTRSILAWRFLEYEPGGIDASLLLYDLLRPLAMNPEWPAGSRYPYIGIPENIVVELFEEEPGTQLAGLPTIRPETIVVDNGRIFTGKLFRDVCEMLGINLYYAAINSPTDKPEVERVFRTAREQLFENYPGYVSYTTDKRGKDAEQDAYLFRPEVDRDFGEWATIYQRTPHTELHHPEVPTEFFSPNDLLDIDIAAAGYFHVPIQHDIFYLLLKTEWRMIHHYGVEINGLLYSHPELVSLYNQKSGYEDKDGLWPFKVDPRLLTYVYFYDERTERWLQLTREFSDYPHFPFTDVQLAKVRELVSHRGQRVTRARLASKALDDLLLRIDQHAELVHESRQAAFSSDSSSGETSASPRPSVKETNAQRKIQHALEDKNRMLGAAFKPELPPRLIEREEPSEDEHPVDLTALKVTGYKLVDDSDENRDDDLTTGGFWDEDEEDAIPT